TMMVGGRLVPKNERDRTALEISQVIKKEVAKIPGIKTIDFTQQDQMAMMSGGAKPISIEIYGQNIAQTDSFALEVKKMLEKIEGMVDVTISREEGKPELWIEVDRQKAAALGLNMYDIANTVRTKFYGKIATKYREAGDEYDTFVRLKGDDRQSLADLENAFVMSPMGKQIPIRNIAKIVEHSGPLTIQRKNQERMLTVGGGLYERPLGKVVTDIEKSFKKMAIPEGMAIKIAGTAQDQAESFHILFIALILGIILVYMVMAAQFESLIDPFIIMFSVPFAIVGVVWALLITGKTLNMVSYVGMIMLVGIVVNNAIVLIDYINVMRARGKDVREAILISAPRRLRPVLMTALTTIFGLLPLALKTGEGAEMWSPLAISVIGGLFASTVITLIFVPTLYSIVEDRIKRKRFFGINGGAMK
ncbi:MAG: efflux RND transporter permease subunit, partial [bacterium]|nr:efflux RND transporter permease subunit [bacterium]